APLPSLGSDRFIGSWAGSDRAGHGLSPAYGTLAQWRCDCAPAAMADRADSTGSGPVCCCGLSAGNHIAPILSALPGAAGKTGSTAATSEVKWQKQQNPP